MIDKSIMFACEKHKNQLRKGTTLPYVLHPLEAMVIASRITENPNVLCAAVLHDVMEDCGVLFEEIEDLFGKKTAEIVLSVTDDKNVPWKERKQKKINMLMDADKDIKIVMLCDKLSNLRAIKKDYDLMGNRVWSKFKGKQKSDIEWYYTEILNAMSDLGDLPEYLEAHNIIDYVFNSKTNYF